MKFDTVSVDQESGFVTGYINGQSFTVCLEQGKRKQYIRAVSRKLSENGSISGLAGESNCPFFESFPESAKVATQALARQAKIKLV